MIVLDEKTNPIKSSRWWKTFWCPKMGNKVIDANVFVFHVRFRPDLRTAPGPEDRQRPGLPIEWRRQARRSKVQLLQREIHCQWIQNTHDDNSIRMHEWYKNTGHTSSGESTNRVELVQCLMTERWRGGFPSFICFMPSRNSGSSPSRREPSFFAVYLLSSIVKGGEQLTSAAIIPYLIQPQ